MNARMDAWLGPLKLRVLLPLVWVGTYAVVSLGALIAMLTGVAPHYDWRMLVFGSCCVTLGTVTGIKTRHRGLADRTVPAGTPADGGTGV